MLNAKHQESINWLEEKLLHYTRNNRRVFVSSSFQTHSIPLLHMISEIDSSVEVLFLQTGFLFPETIRFRDKVVKRLNLSITQIESKVPKINQRNKEGFFYYSSDPDYCCHLNKTRPLEEAMIHYDVWINGVRKQQSEFRASLKKVETATNNVERIHPILDWTSKDIWEYRNEFDLPLHPLEEQGYLSIGCVPCTEKAINRFGRWEGQSKTECGINTDLLSK